MVLSVAANPQASDSFVTASEVSSSNLASHTI